MADVRIGITASDAAGPKIKSVHGLVQGLQAEAKKSILTGIGLGAGVTAFNMLGNAVRGAVGFFGDAIAAAKEDEESVSRLSASLKANVVGWDGNTAAIEKRILAGQKLGFEDDAQRAALTILAGATHNVAKAQDDLSVAMDLARFKHVSLEEASQALVKVEGGRFKLLASLGIQLEAGATKEQALAAVQKVAAGQRQEFARTQEGLDAANRIALDELKEAIGTKLMPVMRDLAKFTRDELVPALTSLVDWLGATGRAMSRLGQAWATVGMDFGSMGQKIHDIADKSGGDFQSVKDRIKGYMLEAGMSFKDAADKAESELTGRTAAAAVAAADKIRAGWETNRPRLLTAAEMLANTLPDALGSAGADAVAIAAAIPGDIAKAIRDGRESWRSAMTQLGTDITDETTRAARIAELKAALISVNLVSGLHSGDPLVLAQAQEARRLILAGLKAEGVWAGGASIISGWVNGMEWTLAQRLQHFKNMAARYGDVLGHSLPTAGPLQHPERGGKSIGEAWGHALAKSIGAVGLNLPTLPDLGLSGGAAGGGGLAMAGAGGGVMEIHVHSHLNGRELSEEVTRQQYYAASGPSRLPRG